MPNMIQNLNMQTFWFKYLTVPMHSDYDAISGITGLRCKGVNVLHQWTLPYCSVSYVRNRFGSFFVPKICLIKVL